MQREAGVPWDPQDFLFDLRLYLAIPPQEKSCMKLWFALARVCDYDEKMQYRSLLNFLLHYFGKRFTVHLCLLISDHGF